MYETVSFFLCVHNNCVVNKNESVCCLKVVEVGYNYSPYYYIVKYY